MKLFTRIDNPDPTWLVRSRVIEHYLPTEVVVTEPKIVTPQVGRSYEIDLYVRWGDDLSISEDKWLSSTPLSWEDAVLIPYDTLRTLPTFEGTSKEIQVRLYEIWGEFGSDGHTDYSLQCWMLCPGESEHPFHRMYDEYYDSLKIGD